MTDFGEILYLEEYWGNDTDSVLEQEDINDEIAYEDLPNNLDLLNFGPNDDYQDIPFDDDNKLLTLIDVISFLRVRGNSLTDLYISKFHIRNPKIWRKILYILNTSDDIEIDDILELASPVVYLQIFRNRYTIGYLTRLEVSYLLAKLRPLWNDYIEIPYIMRLYRFLRSLRDLDEEFEYSMERRREYIDEWNNRRLIDIEEREILLREIDETRVDPFELFGNIENNPNLMYEDENYYYSDED